MPMVDRRLTLPCRFRPSPRARLGGAPRGLEPPARARARRPGGGRGDLRALGRDRGRRSPSIWWSAEPSVWPYALASTLLETVYVLALAYAYRTTDALVRLPAHPRARAGAHARRGDRRCSGTARRLTEVGGRAARRRGRRARPRAGRERRRPRARSPWRRSPPRSPPTRSSTAPGSSTRAR